MATTKIEYSLLFSKITDLFLAMGVNSIKDLSGCAEIEFDADGRKFQIAVNGHPDSIPCSFTEKVLSYHAIIFVDGWPFGVVNPYDGVIGVWSESIEKEVIKILDKRIRQYPAPARQEKA